MENDTKKKTQSVAYYGKKDYVASPFIRRPKVPEHKTPEYWNEDVDEKKAG